MFLAFFSAPRRKNDLFRVEKPRCLLEAFCTEGAASRFCACFGREPQGTLKPPEDSGENAVSDGDMTPMNGLING